MPRSLEQLQQDWNDLADIDPMWAICSSPERQYSHWNSDEFFASGRRQVQKTFSLLERLDIPLSWDAALDFGCGIGRVTQGLAELFDVCYGVDIAPSMINQAREFNRFGGKCRYVLNARDDLRDFSDCLFDFVFTSEVLQHMQPRYMEKYLIEFLRVLKVQGVLVFHIPIQPLIKDTRATCLRSLPRYHPRRVSNVLRGLLIGHDSSSRYYRLRRLGVPKQWLYGSLHLRPVIEMHSLDEASIRSILEQGHGAIVSFATTPNADGTMLMAECIVVKTG
jgi:ubiquinone/menaquinone biosynthesis C-methylase UbiE